MERDLGIYGAPRVNPWCHNKTPIWGEHPAEAPLSGAKEDRRPNAVATKEPVTRQRKDFAKTLEFLERAFRERAHEKIFANLSGDERLRRINMVKMYFYETDAVQKDVGLRYGITRERARQLIKKTVLDLHHNTSVQTQELFPIETLCFRKPLPQKSRNRMSLVHGGITLLIRDGLRAGKSIQQIQEENAPSSSQLRRSRSISRALGVESPYQRTTHSQNIELANKLRTAKTDKEKQELLRQVKHTFYAKHVSGENPILIPITTAIREAGFYISYRNTIFFTTSLTASLFPIESIKQRVNIPTEKTVSYHFFLSSDKERAKKIWLQDKNLQRFLS